MKTWQRIQEKVYSESNEATKNVQFNTPKVRILKNEVKKLSKHNKRKLKILDLGRNDGGISFMLAREGHIVCGVDLPKVIKIAKKRYKHPNLTFITADLSNEFPFKKNTFDIVVAFDIIEHIPDDVKFLQEIYDVLKSKGICILQTPNIGYFVTRLEVLLGIWRRHEYDVHYHHYTFKTIENLFRKVGFKIIKSIGVCYEKGPKKWLLIEKIFQKLLNLKLWLLVRNHESVCSCSNL